MFDRSPKPDRPPLGAIEFELTDFEQARQVLDELPAGLDPTHGDPAFWVSRRRPQTAADRALTGQALEWMVSLPQALRPQQLGRLFPRIANALATVWPEPREALRALDGLLVDRRGGRRGLPDAVQAELRGLQSHLESRPAPIADAASANAELVHAKRLLEAAGYRVLPPAR